MLWAIMVALVATAITIAIGILINLITTPPLPGWLRWLNPGWRQVTALVVIGAASAVIAVFARRADKGQPTAIQGKSQPNLEPRYDETGGVSQSKRQIRSIYVRAPGWSLQRV